MLGDDINAAATSCSSPPLRPVPNVPHQLPTMHHFTSHHSTQGSSQQERAQRLLVEGCGLRPGLSPGSAPSLSSSEQPPPPKLVPIFKKRPSRRASPALLGLRSQETSQLTRMTFPAHNRVSPQPGQPQFRCPLKTTLKQSSERAGGESVAPVT